MNADNIHKDLFGPSDYTLGLLGFLILERVPCLGNTWIHLCSGTLEKILESPLDSKEIKPVNPKGNQSWIFIGRTNAEAEAPILWQPDATWLTGKDPDAGKDWGQEENRMTEDAMVDSITDSVDRSSEGQGSLAFARDWHRPAFECLSVSCGGMCQQWNLFQKDLYQDAITSQDFCSRYHWPRSGHCGLRPAPETPSTHRQVWLYLLQSDCFFLPDPGVHKVLFVPSKSLYPQSCGSSIIKSSWPSKSNFPVGSRSLFQILRLWNPFCNTARASLV